MPDRSYRAGASSPGWRDHFYAHDTLTIVSLAWIFHGLVSVVESVFPSFVTSSSIALFPEGQLFISGLMHVLAGTLTLWGTYTKHKRIDGVWLARKIAYVFIIIGAGLYLFYIFKRVPYEMLAIVLGFSNLLIGVGGIITVNKTDSSTRELMRRQGYDA